MLVFYVHVISLFLTLNKENVNESYFNNCLLHKLKKKYCFSLMFYYLYLDLCNLLFYYP